jgi:hypothetical protein
MFRRAASLPPWGWALACALLPLLIYACMQLAYLPPAGGHLVGVFEPDSWLRLTLVRNWLEGGSWYNHRYASNAPFAATISPWTRPVDLAIALLVKLQPGDAALNLKLLRAALFLPIIWSGLLLGAVFFYLSRLKASPAAYFFAAAILVTASPMRTYFAPGNVDHHAPLALLWAWVAALLMTTDNLRLRALAGMLLGLMLWISPEALLLIAVIYGWFGLQWLNGARNMNLPVIASAVALTATLGMMIERPPAEWFLPIYDSLSIVHVVLLALCAAFSWALYFTQGSFKTRLAVAMIDAFIILLLMHQLYPLFFHGPMAEVTPYIGAKFLPQISEARSLFSEDWPMILAMLVQPLVALWACASNWQHNSALRDATLRIGYLLAVTVAMSWAQQRWFYYAMPMIAIVLSQWLGAVLMPDHPSVKRTWPASWIQSFSQQKQALVRLPIIAALFLLPLFFTYLESERQASNVGLADAIHCQTQSRRLIQSGTLNQFPPMTILAHTNIGAELLFFSHHRIVASNYHREGEGIEYLWELQSLTDASKLRGYLAKRQINALLVCPLSDPPKNSVLQGLYDGSLKFRWLRRVALGGVTGNEKSPVFLRISQ